MKTSDFLTVNVRDIIHSTIMTAGGAAFAVAAESISKGQWTLDWTNIWHTGVAAGVVYLGKRLFAKATIVTPVTDNTLSKI